MNDNILSLDKVGMNDVPLVGGKNASLGEMISNLSNLGVSVPGGFATTASAFNHFLEEAGLTDKIQQALSALDTDDVNALAQTGSEIRAWVIDAPLPQSFQDDIETSYEAM